MRAVALALVSLAGLGRGSNQTPEGHARTRTPMRELAALMLASSSSPTGWQPSRLGRHFALEQPNNKRVNLRPEVLMSTVAEKPIKPLTAMQQRILDSFKTQQAVKKLHVCDTAQWVKDRTTAKKVLRTFVGKNMWRDPLKLYEAAKQHQGNLTHHEACPLVLQALADLKNFDAMIELYLQYTEENPTRNHKTISRVVISRLCKNGFPKEAEEILDKLRRQHPWPSNTSEALMYDATRDKDRTREPIWHMIGSSFIPMLARAYVRHGDGEAAVRLVYEMTEICGFCLPEPKALVDLMGDFAKMKDLDGVYAVIDAHLKAKEINPSYKPTIEEQRRLNEGPVRALMKTTKFDRGYMTLNHLPDTYVPEVAMFGRSNVGKSSLINMVLGRKMIAYVSCKPGKTRSYNYFKVNEPLPGEKAFGNFHIVDMPGLGYARVPRTVRDGWAAFFEQYTAQREQLKVVIHLIDSRVGVNPVDMQIMEMLRDSSRLATGADGQCRWKYVIALTKADKQEASKTRISKSRAEVEEALEKVGGLDVVTITETSSKDKSGRYELWKALQPVVVAKEANAVKPVPEGYFPRTDWSIRDKQRIGQIKKDKKWKREWKLYD